MTRRCLPLLTKLSHLQEVLFLSFFLLNYKYQINERKILQENLKFEPCWQKEKKMDHKIKPTK